MKTIYMPEIPKYPKAFKALALGYISRPGFDITVIELPKEKWEQLKILKGYPDASIIIEETIAGQIPKTIQVI